MQLAHTRLLVQKFAESYRFYRDFMGLKPAWGDEADTYASFKGPDGRIILALFDRQEMAEVIDRGSWESDAQIQDRSMLIFQVDDIDGEVRHLTQRGVQFLKMPVDFPDWGMRGAYLRDPDGNLIELSGGLPSESWSQRLRDADEKWKDRQD